MATIEDTGRMALAMVEAPVQPALELDDDWRSGWCSLFDQVMVMPYAEPGLVALHLWDVHEGPDRLECAAARMVLAGGQRLFVDPSWIFGIHLGGREQERSWAENLGGALPGEVVVALGAGARGAGGSGE